jgi:hypothetical protein
MAQAHKITISTDTYTSLDTSQVEEYGASKNNCSQPTAFLYPTMDRIIDPCIPLSEVEGFTITKLYR